MKIEHITKFDTNDKVWVMDDNKPKEFRVVSITIVSKRFYDNLFVTYNVERNLIGGSKHIMGVLERDIFSSKIELINSLL